MVGGRRRVGQENEDSLRFTNPTPLRAALRDMCNVARAWGAAAASHSMGVPCRASTCNPKPTAGMDAGAQCLLQHVACAPAGLPHHDSTMRRVALRYGAEQTPPRIVLRCAAQPSRFPGTLCCAVITFHPPPLSPPHATPPPTRRRLSSSTCCRRTVSPRSWAC